MEIRNNVSISCDVSLIMRIVLLSKAGQQMLWYMLWKQAQGAKVDDHGYMRVKYRDAQNVLCMQSKTHPYLGLQNLLEANFIERGPVAGWYRITVEGIGLVEH